MKTFFLEQSERTGFLKRLFRRVSINSNKIIIYVDLKKVGFKSKVNIRT